MQSIEKLQRCFAVFDNEGKTFDQYTCIRKRTGDILGSSEHPFYAHGFGQHCGNIKEDYCFRNINNSVGNYLKEARKDIEWQGKEVKDFSSLPEDVLKFMSQELG